MASLREMFLLRAAPGQFAGIAAGDWFTLLRENRFSIDPPYWLRATLVTLASLGNSALRHCENACYGARVRNTEVHAPVFILGHWRSGTTHLQNLLSLDRRFASPNLFQVCFPHSFLCTESVASRLLGLLVPKRRLGDDMDQHLGMPFEDEFAISAATLRSPYLSMSFPRRSEHYDRYMTLCSVPQREIDEWKAGLKFFVQKLAWKYGRPLVLKSPTHTCRIRLLLELFPDARFVHLHRNPYAVFLSTRGRRIIGSEYFRLQRWSESEDEMLIQRYAEMYDRFFAERQLIPAGRYCEAAYEDLQKDPIGQLRDIYGKLDLPPFEQVEATVQRYIASLAGFKKNEYSEMSAALKSRIATAWRRSFDEWGYST